MRAEREAVVRSARRLADRGLSPGSSGNISVRTGANLLITPTGIGFAEVGPEDLALVPIDPDDPDGPVAAGPRPSKEVPLHRAVYSRRPDAGAVVHLHAPWSVALACLPVSHRPWLTPYQVTKVGPLPLVPYALPGSEALADAVRAHAGDAACLLLANHGSIAAGSSLSRAVDTAEELEAAARLMVTLRDLPFRALTDDQVGELRERL